MGKRLMPWQQFAADVATEYDPDTGILYYEEVDITVPRQSGKTFLVLCLLVWRAITMARRLGPQTSTYLAQTGKMARKKLEREFAPILRRARSMHEVPHSRARPVKPSDWKLSMNNGSEHILFGTGSYLQIEAPTDKGSHGDVLDMPVIDEAFAHEGDAVEQAVDAASVTRISPQLYVLSTAGTGRSFYLWRKVSAGRHAVETGSDSKVCYLEWSLPDDVRFDDEEAWARFLPALGHTITLARLRSKLEKALRNEPDDEAEEDDLPGVDGFRRSYLNQWVVIPTDGALGRPAKLPAELWAAAVSSESLDPLVFAFEVSIDNEWTSVVAAGGDQTHPYVEVINHLRSTDWVPQRLVELVQSWNPTHVACIGAGPAGQLVSRVMMAFAAAGLTVKVDGHDRPVQLELLEMPRYRQACGALYADVVEGRLRWFAGSTVLDIAAKDAAARQVGNAWEWDIRNVTVPISPLVAATVARALLPVEVPKKPPGLARVISF